MKITVNPKGCNYEATDKETSKKLYTVKKKSFSNGAYTLNDKNNYKLYTFTQMKTISKPSFSVCHDNDEIIKFVCKSLTGDLVLSAVGYDIHGNPLNYTATCPDKTVFTITSDGEVIGTVKVFITLSNNLQYEMEFNDELYDDYIALFPAAIDLSFSQIFK